MQNDLDKNSTSKTAPGELPESTPMPESAKIFDTVANSFKKAYGQEMKYKLQVREAWYKSMGEAHHLTGLLRSDNALKAHLAESLKIRQHSGTSDQLYLLKLIYKRAGLDIPDQTRHDHSMILIGLEAAKVPPDAEAAEKWLREEEDLDGKRVSGKDKAMIHAKRAQKQRPPNKAAETRIAKAEQKRKAQFESYIAPKLATPLAALAVQTGSLDLADGDLIVVVRKEAERILLLDVLAKDEKTVQTTVLRKL